ncbi:MAG: phosphatidylserine decarboxylase [Alphaproteobacteria bacterium]
MPDFLRPCFIPIHREGHRFVAIGAILTLVLFFVSGWLGAISLLLTLFVATFFRDPQRVVPLRKGLVVAPGDGRIVEVAAVTPPVELGLGPEKRVRVAIFLSVFNVHIQRSPVAGRIERFIETQGEFLNAADPDASYKNERKAMILAMADGTQIAVVQIAGWVARRILTFVQEGEPLGAGERYGLIRFGSRVETYLPPGVNAQVCEGQYVSGGETVIADLASKEGPREAITV